MSAPRKRYDRYYVFDQGTYPEGMCTSWTKAGARRAAHNATKRIGFRRVDIIDIESWDTVETMELGDGVIIHKVYEGAPA